MTSHVDSGPIWAVQLARIDARHPSFQEAGQSKWSAICAETEAGSPAPSRLPRAGWLLAFCVATAGVAFVVSLAVIKPWALSQHQSQMTAASYAQPEQSTHMTQLGEVAAPESVRIAEKKLERSIDQVEKNIKTNLASRLKREIEGDIKKDFEGDVEGDIKTSRAKAWTNVENDVEAAVSKDVTMDVEKDMDKTFGRDMKKDLESHPAPLSPKGAQSVEKKDKDKGNNSSKTMATIHGCCTWAGPCDSSNAFCNVNEGRCKGCGGQWKTDTSPRDFGGWDKAWCAKGKMDTWALPSVPTYKPVSRKPISIKILDWNLAWFAVYKKKGGEGGQQGKWLADSGPYDIIGFQECQNPWQVLGDGGLMDMYHAYQGGGAKDSEAVCVLYKKDTWEEIGHGEKKVAEDKPGKWSYFGKRLAVWYRLRHKDTRETVMFVNHHGPLPLGSGGICGGHATAYNILEVIQNNSKVGDAIILVGDFNAGADSLTVSQLSTSLTRCYSGLKFNGIDHVFTNFHVKRMVHTANLGGHGSDHDALSITFKLGPQ